jgi:hypothetical protein
MIIDLAARHIENLRAEYASISAELLARARYGVAPGQYLTAREQSVVDRLNRLGVECWRPEPAQS